MSDRIRHIYLVNKSNGLLLDQDLALMAEALQAECDEIFCDAQDIESVRVIADSAPPQSGEVIVLYEKTPPGEEGTLGEHWEQTGQIRGAVFLADELHYGGGIFTNPPGAPADAVTILSIVMHELAELLMNPPTTGWWDGPITIGDKTYAEVAAEVADPVEGNLVARTVNGKTVMLSDYVFPDWHDPEAPSKAQAYYNRAGTLHAPFTVDKGGYVIVRNEPGKEESIFAEQMPPHRRAHKERMRAARAELAQRHARFNAPTDVPPPPTE